MNSFSSRYDWCVIRKNKIRLQGDDFLRESLHRFLIGPRPAIPRGQRVRFRVALTGTLRLDVPAIVIAERTEGKHG